MFEYVAVFGITFLGHFAAAQVQPINLTMCQNLGYKYTALPNNVGHQTQEAVAEEINQFARLAEKLCPREFGLFICSTYLPLCQRSDCHDIIHAPCPSLCRSARRGCEPVLNRLGFSWPFQFNCDLIQENPGCLPSQEPEPAVTKTRIDSDKPTKAFAVTETELSNNRLKWEAIIDIDAIKKIGSYKTETALRIIEEVRGQLKFLEEVLET